MSIYNDDRGRQLTERIILLFPNNLWEELSGIISSDQNSSGEVLLELLARQVWGICEESCLYLVTRTVTLSGRVVSLSRGDFAYQVEGVSPTTHTFVTQAFRLGFKVDADWEIVTPQRGLPFPTTRGALQLLEAVVIEEEERPEILPADTIWGNNAVSNQEANPQVTEPILSPGELDSQEQAAPSFISSDTIDVVDEINQISLNTEPAPITNSPETAGNISDTTAEELKNVETIKANEAGSAENSNSVASTNSDDDLQRTIDSWIKLAQQTRSGEEKQTGLNDSTTQETIENILDRAIDVSEKTNNIDLEPSLSMNEINDNREQDSSIEQTNTDAERILPIQQQNNVSDNSTQQQSNVNNHELEWLMSNEDQNDVITTTPFSENSHESDVQKTSHPDIEETILTPGVGSGTIFSELSEYFGDGEDLNKQGQAPNEHTNKQSDLLQEMFQSPTEEKMPDSGRGNEFLDFFDSLSEPSNSVDNSSLIDDKPVLEESIEVKTENIIDESLVKNAEHLIDNHTEVKLPSNHSLSSMLSGCDENWVKRIYDWEENNAYQWEVLCSVAPLRIAWISSSKEIAENQWKKIHDSNVHAVYFENEAIIEQLNKDQQNTKTREVWLNIYRKARIEWETKAARLRLIKSQIDLIGKYFKDYYQFRSDLEQFDSRGATSFQDPIDETPEIKEIKSDLLKLLAKQEELEEQLRKWVYNARQFKDLTHRKYIGLQDQYRNLMHDAGNKGRELVRLISSIKFNAKKEAASNSQQHERERTRINQEITAIERYIDETFSKHLKNDPIWEYFEKKDINGLKEALKQWEMVLSADEIGLNNWQSILEDNPSMLSSQIWVGSCQDASLFILHQYHPHIIIVDDSEFDYSSLVELVWGVIARNDASEEYQYHNGGTTPPYDPQLLWGVFAGHEDYKDMAKIGWTEEMLGDRGVK